MFLFKMKRLWYILRLLTLGHEELLSCGSLFGVWDLTLPAFDSEPCVGTISPPLANDNSRLVTPSFKTKLYVRSASTQESFEFSSRLNLLWPMRTRAPYKAWHRFFVRPRDSYATHENRISAQPVVFCIARSLLRSFCRSLDQSWSKWNEALSLISLILQE